MVTVDRLEGEWAVLCNEDETTRIVRVSELPPAVRAGDVLVPTPQGWQTDEAATAARRAQARRIRRSL